MKIWSKILLLCAFVSAVGITTSLFAAPGCVCELQWNASPSSGIAGYAIYYGISGSGVTTRIDAGLSLSYTITGLAPSTTYSFYVVVYDAFGDESPPSNVALFSTPPISPVQFTQTSAGTVNIQLLVSPGAACEVEYTPTLNPPAWTVITNTAGDSNGLVNITELMSGPQGFFRALIPAEAAPQVSAALGFSPVLQWNPSPTPGTTGYMVYYGVSGSSVTNQINAGSALSLTVTGLTASTPYFFYVVSQNASGAQSSPSNPVLYTTPPISPLQFSQSTGLINLQFQVTPNAACHVEYSTTLNPPVWTVLTNTVADSNGLVTINDPMSKSGSRFYRGSIP
jgi:hypothetical protein